MWADALEGFSHTCVVWRSLLKTATTCASIAKYCSSWKMVLIHKILYIYIWETAILNILTLKCTISSDAPDLIVFLLELSQTSAFAVGAWFTTRASRSSFSGDYQHFLGQLGTLLCRHLREMQHLQSVHMLSELLDIKSQTLTLKTGCSTNLRN